MANILEAPRIARHVEALRLNCPEMVPVDCDGTFIQMAYGDDLAEDIPPSSLSVRAYVVGLELLGYRFDVTDDARYPGLYITEPEHELPKAWRERGLALFGALDRRGSGEGIGINAVVGYLLEREGGPTLARFAVRAS